MWKSTVVALLGLSCIALAAAQEGVIGYVKTAEPDAFVIVEGKEVVAEPGTPVHRGARLRTGSQGSLGIMFHDNTRISMGPQTEVAIDDYLYEPGKGQLKLGASITKGTLHYVSGVIAKLKPEAVSVKTPTGTIGVRGTRFVAKVEPENSR
jgi:hypothetical protein